MNTDIYREPGDSKQPQTIVKEIIEQYPTQFESFHYNNDPFKPELYIEKKKLNAEKGRFLLVQRDDLVSHTSTPYIYMLSTPGESGSNEWDIDISDYNQLDTVFKAHTIMKKNPEKIEYINFELNNTEYTLTSLPHSNKELLSSMKKTLDRRKGL
jgi:hypothetical protein